MRPPSRLSFRRFVATATATALSAAVMAAATVAAASTSTPRTGRITITKYGGITYKNTTQQNGSPLALKLDVYVPQDGVTAHPALMMVHGEGWADGTRKDVATYAQDYARLGFTTYVPDYRESCDPANPASGDDPTLCGFLFPTHLQDLQDAIMFIRQNATLQLHPNWATNPTWLGVWGSSSGGSLGGSLATGWGDPLRPPTGQARPDAILTWSAPMNLVDGSGNPVQPDRVKQYLGCDPYSDPPTCPDGLAASASPYYQIQASDSPMFLMGSTQDTINPITTQTIPMYNALLAAGVGTQLYQIDSTCHGVKCKAQDPGLEPNSANWGHAYLDATQPTVHISSGPMHPSKASVATFAFSAGVATNCGLDGGAMTSCTSPVHYSGLLIGAHTFTVQDAAGTGAPATLTWNVTAMAISISDSTYTPNAAKSLQGGYVKWTNKGTVPHTVTDKSGMNLFSSGSLGVGATFQTMFIGAGTYYYNSTLDPPSFQGTVQIPMQASSTSGPVNSSFTVQWAAGAPPTGFRYDVQWKKPGDTTWSFLPGCGGTCKGTTTSSWALNLGLIGAYRFQARLTKTSITPTKSSAWSPTLSITTS